MFRTFFEDCAFCLKTKHQVKSSY